MRLDLTSMPSGARYEDRYGEYLDIFHQIGMFNGSVAVVNPPASWVPLLLYLNVDVYGYQCYFEHDHVVARALSLEAETHIPRSTLTDRSLLEALVCFRPETLDALWKFDMQDSWRSARLHCFAQRQEFIVTTNGGFYRPEVLEYLNSVSTYKAPSDKVVLMPCAADKPYPAPMHSAVIAVAGPEYYVANVTGVLGIVPRDLWPVMPHYDLGLPNEWRVMNMLRDYFLRNKHSSVVVYLDYYNITVNEALAGRQEGLTFVNPIQVYCDYLNLLDPIALSKLYVATHPECNDGTDFDATQQPLPQVVEVLNTLS